MKEKIKKPDRNDESLVAINYEIKHNGLVFCLFWGALFFEIGWEGWR
jgi:hypothetical protein